MAKTAAQRMKEYRKRLKINNPEKYKQQMKKQLERVKARKKKINEMSDLEKQKQREAWRKHKKAQRDRQNPKNKSVSTPKNNERVKNRRNCNKTKRIKYLVTKCNTTNISFQKHTTAVELLNNRINRYKKRITRSLLQMKTFEKEVIKAKAREEVLELALKKTYKNAVKQAEKNVLKAVIRNSKCKTYVAKLMGFKQVPKQYIKKSTKKRHIKEIVNFFIRDDVSRITAGKKECRTKNKDKQQIRYLLDTLTNLYKKYRKEGGKYKFTTFYNSKPFYVLSPTLASRNTCLCVKHENINLQFLSLKKKGVLQQNSVKDVLLELACSTKSYNCMHGKCSICRNNIFNYDNNQLNNTITWRQWERKEHKYEKNNDTFNTKIVKLTTKEGMVIELLEKFKKDIQAFKKHYFNVFHQQDQYQKLLKSLQPNEALVVCDFSQNYELKLAEEIQSMHFGASKSQVTLHTGMIYFHDKMQSFCSISADNSHNPPAIWAHLTPVMHLIKQLSPDVSVIHIYSDGPSSQYRQKNNFYLFNIFSEKLGLDYATWSYFEAGHGKGVADGIGGSVKRTLDKKVSFGLDLSSAWDVFDMLNDVMKVVKIFYITAEDIKNVSCLLLQNVPVLKGTLQLHQIISYELNSIQYRDISCFCSPRRGTCSCFSPQLHSFSNAQPSVTQSKSNQIKTLKPSTRSISKIITSPNIESIKPDNFIRTTNTQITIQDNSNTNTVAYAEKKLLPITWNENIDAVKINDFELTFDHATESNNFENEVIDIDFNKVDFSDLDGIDEEIKKIEVDEVISLLEASSKSKENRPKILKPPVNTNFDTRNTNSSQFKHPVVRRLFPYFREDSKKTPTNLINDTPAYPMIDLTNFVDQEQEPALKKIKIEIQQKNISSKGAPKRKKLHTSTENTKQKSLCTVVKRKFLCEKCNVPLILNCIAKCMACKSWHCKECSNGYLHRDYICIKCLEED